MRLVEPFFASIPFFYLSSFAYYLGLWRSRTVYAGLYILTNPRLRDGLLVIGLHEVAALLVIQGRRYLRCYDCFQAPKAPKDDPDIGKQTKDEMGNKNKKEFNPCIYTGCRYA
jgi:hypothetical protein